MRLRNTYHVPGYIFKGKTTGSAHRSAKWHLLPKYLDSVKSKQFMLRISRWWPSIKTLVCRVKYALSRLVYQEP